MIAVSNSSCLIALGRIRRLNLLPELFEKVIVPSAVWHEVVEVKKNLSEVEEIVKGSWIERVFVKDSVMVEVLKKDLGRGESETIVLALEHSFDWVILDDADARFIAERLGLKVVGTIGLILKAYKMGKVSNPKNILRNLKDKGFWLNEKIYQKIIKEL